MGFSGTPNNGTPWAPYYSHTTPIRIPKDMGIVWEAYHKGVPLLGVTGIILDLLHLITLSSGTYEASFDVLKSH